MTRLYLITPSTFQLSAFAKTLEEALSGGDVACVQLRMKDEMPSPSRGRDREGVRIGNKRNPTPTLPFEGEGEHLRKVREAARILKPIVKAHKAEFIINDYPEIAVEVGADGVHLGDEDMTATEARKIVGEELVIGISCYGSKDRAFEAGDEGADYVAFGQFYETKTKPAKGRPTPELLEFWSQYTTVPSVAIGGIKPDNLAPLVKARADFIAAVTGVWEHPKGPKAAVQEYNAAIAAAMKISG